MPALAHDCSRAAAKGVALQRSVRHAPFTAARGKRGNTPKTQMAGGPGAGRSTGTDHARQRARSGGVTRTLGLRHELRRALSRVGTSELDRGGCVGRRRVAPPRDNQPPMPWPLVPLPPRLNAEPRQVPEHPHVRGDAHCGHSGEVFTRQGPHMDRGGGELCEALALCA